VEGHLAAQATALEDIRPPALARLVRRVLDPDVGTAGYLSRIEKGADKYPPGEDVLRKLAELLDDDFDELMSIAKRVAEEVKNHVRKDPDMPEFLRQVREKGIPAERLIKMLKKEEDEK
jgi:transcriptional regulator with XRE-family HTH domain